MRESAGWDFVRMHDVSEFDELQTGNIYWIDVTPNIVAEEVARA